MSPDKNTSLKPFLVIKFNNNNNSRIIFYFYTSSEIREKFLTLDFMRCSLFRARHFSPVLVAELF